MKNKLKKEQHIEKRIKIKRFFQLTAHLLIDLGCLDVASHIYLGYYWVHARRDPKTQTKADHEQLLSLSHIIGTLSNHEQGPLRSNASMVPSIRVNLYGITNLLENHQANSHTKLQMLKIRKTANLQTLRIWRHLFEKQVDYLKHLDKWIKQATSPE